MNWLNSFRRQNGIPKTTLRVEAMEDRTVPTIVITGTPGNDTVTSKFFFDATAGQYRGEISLNGAVVSSFLSTLYTSPAPSIFLLEPLEVDTLGGNDKVDLSALRDPEFGYAPIIVHGGKGNDTIIGSYGHDRLYGDEGADSLNGGVDEDQLFGDENDVSFVGGGGTDLLTLENYSGLLRVTDKFINMNGNKLTTASGKFAQIAALNITGSNGPDTFDLDQFPSFLVNVDGKGGDDIIRVNANRGIIQGGDGNDTIVSTMTNYSGEVTILGGNGNDTIRVSSRVASIDGGAGDDIIDGRNIQTNNGGLYALGGSGNDTITGSTTSDALYGGDGNDTIVGGLGNDLLSGDAGVDSLNAGDGDDQLFGDGNDTRLLAGTGNDTLTVTDLSGNITATNSLIRINNRRVSIADTETLSLSGAATNDTIDASGFVGIVGIDGGDGNDTLITNDLGSYLSGGNGNDKLFGGKGNDTLDGGAGADRMTGNAGDDLFYTDLADTLIAAGAGFDTVSLSDSGKNIVLTDTLLTVDGKLYPRPNAEAVYYFMSGTAGDDTFDATAYSQRANYYGLEGNDFIRTGIGADYVNGGEGNNTIFTGEGDDYIETFSGNDVIDAGNGDNGVNAGEGNNTITSGVGIDYIRVGDGDNTISTGAGDDNVLTGNGNNNINAGAGDDIVFAGTGNDTLLGGDGNDNLYGNDGNDYIDGGLGNDTLTGANGIDQIYGGDGQDLLTADLDDTVVRGGAGYDILRVSSNSFAAGVAITLTDTMLQYGAVTFLNHESEYITLSGTNQDDTLDARSFTGALTFYGLAGNDLIQSGSGNDNLDGGEGDDIIEGGAGDDRLDGGAGNDTLNGGTGIDILVGGTGADAFVIDSDPINYGQEQLVWDFNAADGDVLI